MLLFATLVSLTAGAQSMTWQSVNTTTASGTPPNGASPYYSITESVLDASGNIIVAGGFQGTVTFGSTTLQTGNSQAVASFIAKWNPSTSTWMWAYSSGTTNASYFSNLATSGNALYVAGNFTGNTTVAGVTLTSPGYNGLFLAKFIDNGTSLSNGWAVGMSGSNQPSPPSTILSTCGIAVVGNAVYMAGDFTNDITLQGTTLNSAGSRDVYVAKYIDNGSSVSNGWAIRAGGTDGESPQDMAASSSGIYLVGGFSGTNTYGSTTLTSSGSGSDVFLVKFADNGSSASVGWALKEGGSQADLTTDIVVNGSTIYTGGNTTGTDATIGGTALTNAASTTSVFVAKYLDNGSNVTPQWGTSSTANGSNSGQVRGIGLNGSSVFITGLFNTSITVAGTDLTGSGSSDTYVARFTDNGTSVTGNGALGAGSSASGEVGASVLPSGNTLYNTGTTRAGSVFGSYTIPNNGPTLLGYIAKINVPAAVSLPTITSLSPTSGPSGTEVTINGTNLSGATSVLLRGIPCKVTPVSATQVRFTVPAAASGGTVRLTTPGGTALSPVAFAVTRANTLNFPLVTESFSGIDVGDFSAPTFTDLDGDGLLDLLVGENNGNLNHYEQDAPNATSFTLVTESFSGIDVVDFSAPAPAFTDLDGDGLLDLLVGEINGNLNHYEQDAPNATNFTLVTESFNGIDVGEFSIPAFTDLDGDGLLDMLVGERDGNLNHYEQSAPNATSFTLVTESFNGIDVGSASAPTFTDLDGDGLLDLLVGEINGNLNHYEQDAPNATSFTLVTESFNGIDVGSSSAPTFTDLDGDGLLDLLVGENNGNLNHYEQAPAPAITSFDPTGGPVGTSITVTGTNLEGATAARVNGMAGTITANDATSLTFTVAAGSTTGPVSVTTPGGTATGGNFTVQTGPATRYVNASRPDDNGDGLSWATAHKYLQTAITAAQSGDQIWVAQGTYKPTTSTDRTISFVMKENVKIYGGFTSGQANLTDRNTDPATNNTILSGDINNDNALAGNSYHVILNINNGLTAEAVLDGFTITGGNGDGTGAQVYGGGMFCVNSSPTIIRCIFRANAVSSSGGFGGAVALQSNSSPLFVNCSFEANEAGRGGGVSSQSGSPKFTNCSFVGNSAPTDGGAFSTGSSSSPQLTNCSFLGNRANRGEAIINQNSSILLTNCVLFGNGNLNEKTIFNTNATVSANYCLIEAGETDYSGSNNLTTSVNPFVSNESTELSPCSPAIDAGDDAANNTTIDLAGNVRKVRTIDMGAYEYQGVYSPNQRTWIGVVDNNWNEPGNWSPACVPTVTDVVYINPAPNAPIISSGQSIEAGEVNVNPNAALTVASGGIFTVRGGATFGLVLRGASFTNNGTVNIESVSGGIVFPFYLEGTPSNVLNNGHLRIVTTSRAIALRNASTITNNSSGSIEILNEGIGITMYADNGTINNYGTMNFTLAGSAITLDEFTGNAFNNYGRITLNRSNQGNPSINIAVNNEFNNYACGKIVFTTGGGLTNNGTLTNAGLFIGGLSNSGTFTNTGVLDRSPSGAFTNQGIIVSRTTTYPNPIFTYGTGNDNVVNGIFADTTASTSAGTFSPSNDFTPNSAATRLFASISPAGGACSYIVPFFYTLPTFSFQGQPTVTNVSCNGGNDGSISVSASGAVGSITYALSPGNSQNGTGNFSNLMAGSNYIVTATDEANRTINTSAITITQPDAIAAPTLSASPGNTTTNQPITVSASGCAGTVSWNTTGGTDNNDGTYTFTDAGSYSISATCTVGGCVSPASQTLNLTINSCTLALGQPTVSNLTCFESGDGAIALTATGGSGSLTYTLSPGNGQNATGSFTGLSAGSYTVSVTDASQCSATSGSISLTQPAAVPAPTLSADPGTTTTNQPITVSASGCAGTVSWNTSGGTDNNDGTYTFSAVGNYTISATCSQNGCTSPTSQTLNLTINNCTLALGQPTVTNLTCFESGDGAIALTATGGAGSLTYTLSPGNVQNATGSFSGLSAGTYTVSVTDASQCSATSASIQVTQPEAVPAPTLSADPGNTTTNQPITVSASGCAGTVNWNTSGGTDNNDGTYTFSAAGSYSVSATCTVDGCTSPASQTLNLTINACALALGQPTVTNLTCFESGDGAIALSATGGAGSLTYTLNPGNVQNATGSFNGLSVGSYTVSVSDANSCAATSGAIQVTQPGAVNAPTLSASPGSTTTNQPITVTAAGCSGTVSWTATGGTDNNDGTYTFSTPGSYTVSATCTVEGCTSPASQTLNLTINACALALGQPSVTNLTCFESGDGAITIGSTGGSGAGSLTYTLNPGNGQNATGSFTGLSAGTYTVSVSDANQCFATSGVIQVTQPAAVPAPTLSADPGTTTTNQPITVSASGCSGTVSWTAGGGTGVANGNQYTFSTPGSYTVSAICTLDGCTSPASEAMMLTINECPTITLNIDSRTDVACFGASSGSFTVTATGGAAPYAYSIGGQSQGNGAFTDLPAGTYPVIVTDANGCTGSASVTISQPATALSVQASGNTSVIYGYGSSCTTLTASASGGKPGYTYAWNNGTQGPTLNVCPTQTTTYTVTVTDANQCVATRQVTVTVTDVRCGSTGGGILMCANGRETCVAQYLVATYLRFGYQLGPCSTGNTRQAADEPGGADLSLSLTAYPNPTSGQVTVQVQGAVPGLARFELVNAQGRAVQQQAHRLSEGHNEVPLELGAQPAGNYLIRCIDALGRQATVRVNRQ